MKLSNDGKDTVERLHLVSGMGKENSRNFFESLLTLIIIDYLEGESTYLPFIGEIKINYAGDTFHKDKKKAVLRIDFSASDELARNIGQIEDGDETDIEGVFEQRLQNALNERLEQYNK